VAEPEPTARGGGRARRPPADLAAGRVGRAHGLDGSFYVTGARPGLLRVGTAVTMAGASRVIVRVAGTAERPIVRLEGIEDRAGAESARGLELTLERTQAPSLPDGEWWADELVGCEVVDGERLLGTVARLIELPSCEALEVRGEHHEPLLVPMVKDAIRSVEPEQRRIEVSLEFLGLAQTDADAPARPQERPRRRPGGGQS
jgi:16S rRNA processing protein RimM